MTSTDAEYKGRRILLVGRASRLLPVVAAEFQEQGARVVLADPAIPGDIAIAQGIMVLDGPSHPASSVPAAIDQLGGLDVLVCHSGPGPSGALLDTDRRVWRVAVDCIIGEAFELSHVAAANMKDAGGAIVHVFGPDALHAYPWRSVAATSFSAIGGMIRALAVELAACAIRALGVIHGPLEGGPVGAPLAPRGDTVARTLQRSPNGRLATAADVAAAIRFAAGPRARFMTGQTLRVDGGWASLNQPPPGMKFV